MNKIKKLLLVVLLMFTVLSTFLFAQVDGAKFDFCNDVSSKGLPIGSYSEFNCNSNSCYVYGLLHLPYVSTAKYVTFYVYYGDSYVTEYTYYNPGKKFDYVYQKMTFSYGGQYTILIYTQQSSLSDPIYIGKSYVWWNF